MEKLVGIIGRSLDYHQNLVCNQVTSNENVRVLRRGCICIGNTTANYQIKVSDNRQWNLKILTSPVM